MTREERIDYYTTIRNETAKIWNEWNKHKLHLERKKKKHKKNMEGKQKNFQLLFIIYKKID